MIPFDGLSFFLKAQFYGMKLVSPFAEQHGAYHHLHDAVRIAVGSRSPILQVATPVDHDLARDPHGRVVKWRATGKVTDMTRFAGPRQSPLIVFAAFRVVRTDVTCMLFAQLPYGLLDLTDVRQQHIQQHYSLPGYTCNITVCDCPVRPIYTNDSCL